MPESLQQNATISHYRIVEKIGAGGMGEVYLAEDTKLDRKIALKLLPSEFTKDEDRVRRFVQEAKATSALNHPNIITIYEIGEVDQSHFIATEFIEGRTLRQIMTTTMQLGVVIEIAIQIASALDAASAAGIVHRDIKPENVMVRPDGLIKILDFGLAKLAERGAPAVNEDAPTALQAKADPGTIIGTVTYMSPEQVEGLDVDSRTDIFSLGTVLYEMVTGQLPFKGQTAGAIFGAILHKTPTPPSQLKPELPAELERILMKALRKNREERYQTSKDLVVDLRSLKQELEIEAKLGYSLKPTPGREAASGTTHEQIKSETEPVLTASTGTAYPTSSAEFITAEIKKHKLGAAVSSLIVLALMGIGIWFFFIRTSTDNAAINSIAVLPFTNASGDKESEFLSDGIAETLINNFTKIPELKVTARSTAFRFRGREGEPQEIGRELAVGAVLAGKLLQRQDTLSIQVDLIKTTNGIQIWGDRYEGNSADIVKIQQRIAADVSSQLKLRLSGAQQQQVARTYTQNSEAYQHYLRGRYYWDRRTADDLKKGLREFRSAAEIDPNYALAYVGLADTYLLLGDYAEMPSSEALPQARAFATKALQIDDSLGEAYATLGMINYYSWQFSDAE